MLVKNLSTQLDYVSRYPDVIALNKFSGYTFDNDSPAAS
jgi:hypothetical protein